MTIEDRVTRLERSSRRWRLMSLALAMGLGVLLSGWRASDETVAAGNAKAEAEYTKLRVRALEIVDEKGNVHGFFGTWIGQGFLRVGPSDHGVTLSSIGDSLSIDGSGSAGHCTLDADSLRFAHKDKERDKRLKDLSTLMGVGSSLRVQEELSQVYDVKIGTDKLTKRVGVIVCNSGGEERVVIVGREDGGAIEVVNRFDKRVVTIQADKRNEGLIGVFDVNGKPVDILPRTRN